MNGRQTGRSQSGPPATPNLLPMPRVTTDLYGHLGRVRSIAHPLYALSKMVPWYGGWQRDRKKAPSVKDCAFRAATSALSGPEVRELAERARARREAWISPLERAGLARRLVLTARTDAVVRLVSPGPLELGLALHHVYGVPFLPGSSLKGLARRVAREMGKSVARDRYGSQETVGPIAILDGLPCSDWKVQRDVMTPHFGEWYQGKRSLPDDTEDPVPIPFLSVGAGSRFEVALLARDVSKVAMLDSVTEDLRQGLDELGLGAKTAAGYGVFGVEVAPLTLGSPSSSPPGPHGQPEQVGDVQAPSTTKLDVRVEARRRSPQAEAVEDTIRTLKAHEVSGRLQAVVADIRRCPEGQRPALFRSLRTKVEELVGKKKDIQRLLARYPELCGEER